MNHLKLTTMSVCRLGTLVLTFPKLGYLKINDFFMMQYLVFGILLLKILIISSLTRGYLLTEKEPTGSWYAEIADL